MDQTGDGGDGDQALEESLEPPAQVRAEGERRADRCRENRHGIAHVDPDDILLVHPCADPEELLDGNAADDRQSSPDSEVAQHLEAPKHEGHDDSPREHAEGAEQPEQGEEPAQTVGWWVDEIRHLFLERRARRQLEADHEHDEDRTDEARHVRAVAPANTVPARGEQQAEPRTQALVVLRCVFRGGGGRHRWPIVEPARRPRS